jgi:hypothetical protein
MIGDKSAFHSLKPVVSFIMSHAGVYAQTEKSKSRVPNQARELIVEY